MTDLSKNTLQLAKTGLTLACSALPHLSGIARQVRIEIDERVETAGVFASGRLLVAPRFFEPLTLEQVTFVMAHEIMHLALQTHDRGQGADRYLVNVAHDLIINDMLRRELNQSPLPGSLDVVGAARFSLERWVCYLQQNPDQVPPTCWGAVSASTLAGGLEPVEEAVLKARKKLRELQERGVHGDALPPELEHKWFTDATEAAQGRCIGTIRELAEQSASLDVLFHQQDEVVDPDRRVGQSQSRRIQAVREFHDTPWETALQRWLDENAPAPRSYARPSRRGGTRTDVVLPGRNRSGWMLHVVLDTSGSMWDYLPGALGTVAEFSQNSGVDTIHLLQCDMEITSEDWLAPEELHEMVITGFKGVEGLRIPPEAEPEPQTEPDPEPSSPDPWNSEPPPRNPRPRPVQEPYRRRSMVQRREFFISPPVNQPLRPWEPRKRKTNFKPTRLAPVYEVHPPGLPDEINLQASLYLGQEESDLSDAVLHLAEDPSVEAVIVITDGWIGFPLEEPQFSVLWCLVHNNLIDRFEPPYGEVLMMNAVN